MTRALLVAFLAAALYAPAGAAADRYPQTVMIDDVPAQVDDDGALAGVQVYLPGGLDRQTAVQNGFAALLGEVVARTPVAAGNAQLPLRDAIAALGAGLTVSVEPQDVRYYVEGRPAALHAALAMLGGALASPDFSHATVASAKRALTARIIDANESPFGVVSAMLRSAYYPGSGAGFAPMGTQAVVANASADGVRRFWSDNYRGGGVTLAAAGHVDADLMRALHAAIANLPSGQPRQVTLKTHKPTDPPARIVTHRDVGLPWVGMGFAAPAAGTKDFAAMLVVQAIIASLGRTDTIVSRPAALRPINAIYQYDVKPANFIVYSSGNSVQSATSLREVFAATDLLASKPLDASVIGRYRTLAIGQFA
ncbi:MAG: insulinase family protein, partial [Candidatus Eremiobacteraeota bacterium]|nr:insulinase family protein [Candidatus Eremiobacteraeota bacterium]